jgi:predicted HicB family RNase H-like nuclease
MKKTEYYKFNLRLPPPVSDRLLGYHQEHPHFSLNSLIIEAVARYLESLKKEGQA